MKEIQAYVRPEQVEEVVRALRDAGVPHMTIFAHQVDRAVKVLTGAEGPSALK